MFIQFLTKLQSVNSEAPDETPHSVASRLYCI